MSIPHKKRTLRVTSTNGILTVDKQTGQVMRCDMYLKGDDYITKITRFHLSEYKQTYQTSVPDTLDILDLGYWNIDKSYEEPAYEWRQDLKILQAGGEV